MKKTLLLNTSYEVLAFITYKKAFKLLYKEKAEILNNWTDLINWGPIQINHPSILRLKNHVKRNFSHSNFSRRVLVKRDKSTCQYCGVKLTASQITIDHVVPKSHGGATSFTNCVVSCHPCNNKKADKTPEQVGMVLLKKPTHPSFTSVHYNVDDIQEWCDDWDTFLI